MNKSTLQTLTRLRLAPPSKLSGKEREHYVWTLGLLEGWGMRGEHEERMVNELVTVLERLDAAIDPTASEADD